MIRLRFLLVVVLAVGSFAALWAPAPIPYGGAEKDPNHPVTFAAMRATGGDIDERVPPGKTVLTVMAEYYAFSERAPPYTSRIYHLTSPQHGQLEGYNRTQRAERIERGLARKLENGSVGLVILTERTHYMLDRWNLAEWEFRMHYCRVVPTPGVYAQYDVNIYTYQPTAAGCPGVERWAWDEP